MGWCRGGAVAVAPLVVCFGVWWCLLFLVVVLVFCFGCVCLVGVSWRWWCVLFLFFVRASRKRKRGKAQRTGQEGQRHRVDQQDDLHDGFLKIYWYQVGKTGIAHGYVHVSHVKPLKQYLVRILSCRQSCRSSSGLAWNLQHSVWRAEPARRAAIANPMVKSGQ